MKKNKSNFRIDIVIIFIVLLLGPATGLILSKTNIIEQFEFLDILVPEIDVYEQIVTFNEDEIVFSSSKFMIRGRNGAFNVPFNERRIVSYIQ